MSIMIMAEQLAKKWRCGCAICSRSAVFANYPFWGFQYKMGLTYLFNEHDQVYKQKNIFVVYPVC